MFDIHCALPLDSELFTQALHPTSPILAVGLASGHVQAFRLPTDSDDSNATNDTFITKKSSSSSSNSAAPRRSSLSSRSSPTPLIADLWRTRRHKGSCRTAGFSAVDGRTLFTGGTDGLVKAADTETGRVVSKIAVSDDGDAPCVLHSLTPTSFLLATDSGAVYLYDTRESASSPSSGLLSITSRPAARWTPHDDYVSSLVPIPASSTSTSGLPRAFATAGGLSVALTDVRKGVVSVSLDGNEPYTGLALSSPSGKLVVGDAAGNLTSWDRSDTQAVQGWKNGLGRQHVDVTQQIRTAFGESITVPGEGDSGNAIEVLCAVPEDSLAAQSFGHDDCVVVGWETGRVEIVALKGKGKNGLPATKGKVVADFPPDAEGEGITGLGFDSTGRLVVGAGEKVVIYAQTGRLEANGEEAEEGEGEDDSEAEDANGSLDNITIPAAVAKKLAGRKRGALLRGDGDDSEDEEGGEDDDDDDEEMMEEEEEAGSSSSDDEEEKRKRQQPKKKKRKGKAQNHMTFNLGGID